MATQRLATQVEARQRAAARLQENQAAVTEAIARELQSVADEPIDGELRTLSRVVLDVAIERFSEGDSPIDSDGTAPLQAPDSSRSDTDSADDATADEAGGTASTGGTGAEETESSPTPAEPSGTTEEPSSGQQPEATASADTPGQSATPTADAQSTGQPAQPTPSAPAAGGTDAAPQQQAATADSPKSAEAETESEAEQTDSRSTGRVTDPIAKAREEDPDEEYVVRFFNERTGVGAIGNPTPQGALAGTIEYLSEQRALDNYLSLPWGEKDGQALLTREPEHPDGSPMEPAHELNNGYYLWTAVGTDACRSTVKDLAENLGLRVMFQGDWD